MTCPRCGNRTDRERWACGTSTLEREPLVCTPCLRAWDILLLTDGILVDGVGMVRIAEVA